MKAIAGLLAVLVAVTTLAGGRTEKRNSDRLAGEELSAGYALLFKLLSDEKDVSKLLIVKKERSELHDVIKRISEAAGDAHKKLEKQAKQKGINLKDERLPGAEQAARESISKEKRKQLLGTKGEEFEFNLLLAQNEALTYGIHLARVISEAENDAARRQALTETAEDFQQLRSQVYQMLRKDRAALQTHALN